MLCSSIWQSVPNRTISSPGAYLIFVTTATTGGGVLFLSRRTFSHRDAKGIALSKGFPEEEKIQILKKLGEENTIIWCYQIHHPRYQMFHLMQQIHHPNDKDTKYSIPIKKCANQNTKYANLNTKCVNQNTK